MTYQHPFEEQLSLQPNENAAIFVDETGAVDMLRGSVFHTGDKIVPELDKATVTICPDSDTKKFDLNLFKVIGSNMGCLG